MKKIFLLTGNVHSGKTTKILEWISRHKDVSFSGILEPVIDGFRYLKNISTGELNLLEANDPSDSIAAGNYNFSGSAFEWGRKILQTASDSDSEYLIIDEFGKLEIEDQGLNPLVSSIIKDSSKIIIIIIRESLVDKFLKKYSLSRENYEIFNFQNPTKEAFILSGGKNSRMGKDKSLLKIGDDTVIEILIDRLKKFFMKINIISNEPTDYLFTGLDVYMDKTAGYGPVSGIHSALLNSSREYNLIVSSDMPLIPEETYKYLSDHNSDYHMVCFRDKEIIHPFPGIYSRKLVPAIEGIFEKGISWRKIHEIAGTENTLLIEAAVHKYFTPDMFFNMNTPGDYNNFLTMFARK